MMPKLRHMLAGAAEPKRVPIESWRDDARDQRVSLSAHERITVNRPKARFATLDPYTPYTGWVHPGRSGGALLWLASVGGLAWLGRKTGRGPLKDLYNWAPFSVTDEER